jgi:hypothetical protein
MVKLKVDHRDVTEEERGSVGSFAPPPPPGIYPYRVEAFNDGFSRGEDGKDDKTKPRFEAVLSCAVEKHAGSKLWAYFLQEGHPSYNKKDKAALDQFFVATGALSAKKRTGTIDTDKDVVGSLISVQVGEDRQADANGDKRARYIKSFPIGDQTVASSDEGLLEEGGEEIEGDVIEGDEVDWEARKAELLAMSAPEVAAVGKEWKANGWEITIAGKKADLVDAIIAIEQQAAEQTEGDDEGVIEDDVIEDDEVIDDEEATPEGYTQEQLEELDNPGLVSVAKELEVFQKGMKRSAVIEAILEKQAIGQEPF